MNTKRINKFITLEIEHDAHRAVFGELSVLIDKLRTNGKTDGYSSLEKATYLVAAIEVEKLQKRAQKAWYRSKDKLKAA